MCTDTVNFNESRAAVAREPNKQEKTAANCWLVAAKVVQTQTNKKTH